MAISLSPTVTLGGQALPAAWQSALVELRVERQFQVPSRVTLRFVDPGYALVDSAQVSLGTTVVVSDPTGESELISAEVTSVAVDQRVREQPELVVTAHDLSHRLARATSVQTFATMAYSDVVSQLASAAGLTPSVDSTTITFDYFMQADSNLGLITELARRVGYDWWVEDTTLYFKAPAAGATVSLTLGVDLLSFSARAVGHGPDTVVVDGWDRDQQELVTANGSSSGVTSVVATSPLATLASGRSSAFGSAQVVVAGIGAHSQSEATVVGDALLGRATLCAVSAQGTAAGNAAIKPGVMASIADAGNTVSGTYPVTRVEHIFRPSSGFITRFFSGDRRPSTLVDTLGAAYSQAPTHVHAGLVVGMVTNIDQSTGRVKVRYPGLSTQYETGWARVVAIGGGASRGGIFVPEVNDEVLVAFEGGDPRQPVVIGGLYGAKSTFPSTVTIADGTVQSRGLTSRLGHSVQLLDGTEDAKQAIELSLAGGQQILHMGKDKMTITVPSGYEFSISAGSSSITIGTDGGITISAPKISLTGNDQISASGAQISLSADTTLSLEGQVQASLKGAQVQIQAEGPLQAQGEPVMIN